MSLLLGLCVSRLGWLCPGPLQHPSQQSLFLISPSPDQHLHCCWRALSKTRFQLCLPVAWHASTTLSSTHSPSNSKVDVSPLGVSLSYGFWIRVGAWDSAFLSHSLTQPHSLARFYRIQSNPQSLFPLVLYLPLQPLLQSFPSLLLMLQQYWLTCGCLNTPWSPTPLCLYTCSSICLSCSPIKVYWLTPTQFNSILEVSPHWTMNSLRQESGSRLHGLTQAESPGPEELISKVCWIGIQCICLQHKPLKILITPLTLPSGEHAANHKTKVQMR